MKQGMKFLLLDHYDLLLRSTGRSEELTTGPRPPRTKEFLRECKDSVLTGPCTGLGIRTLDSLD
jgi:hypothetical protein